MTTDSGQSSTRLGTDADAEPGSGRDAHMTGLAGRLAFAWAFVGIPLAYGVFETAKKAAALFTG